MKTLLTITALLLSFVLVAQSSRDRVMLQQIAALKTYGSYLKKGYRIARDGLNFIGDLKDGELNLHSLFFEGLDNVSPFVQDYPKAGAIVTLNARIAELQEKLSAQLDDALFYGNEKDYIRRVIARVLEGCADDLEELEAVLSQTGYTADDAERIDRIDTLYANTEDRYRFAHDFYDQCMLLVNARAREARSVQQSERLYNLKP
ncbi:hypothetical protein GCM10007424_00660 [Flavobacterium suaedae]|uniref:TerB family tellurite resistance protein n=1 Tax=Flavobacterium suaedae TaxID=1767027 RepID=A0ABQ1JDS1_9FLAO|nr:hypothetical protein [Flavobacterium suaedae]GGB64642.1 hypothetical protein GCM10007424_00660 [Flavobacterium suaedae]